MTVEVDAQGYLIVAGMHRLDQKQAVDLANALLRGVEQSIQRNQRLTNRYFTTEAILERQESRLGQAIIATQRVFE